MGASRIAVDTSVWIDALPTVGVLDLILSAMCLRGGWPIWSLDAHFPVIARQEKRLRLFVPGEV
jgi:hypothetical protein